MLCATCQEHTATVTESGERVWTEPPPPLESSRIAANALNEGRRGNASAAFATSLDLAGRRTKPSLVLRVIQGLLEGILPLAGQARFGGQSYLLSTCC